MAPRAPLSALNVDSGVCPHRRRSRVPDGPSFAARFADHRRLTLLLLPILLLGTVALARAGSLAPARPNVYVLTGGAGALPAAALTALAAEELERALATGGGGITFEIVQTSTITAIDGGPLVEIPDPTDRTKSLGEAERYVMGTLIERGFATPDGYWMEFLHGPEPGAEVGFDTDKAPVSRQALVRDGQQFRNDGEGWHEADLLPGIGLDPATIAKLAGLVTASASASDVPLELAQPIDPAAAKDAPLGPETVALDAGAVAATITGLRGTERTPVRALATTVSADALPGIIAIDLAAATELAGPVELRFDDAGRLVGLTVLARNTNLEVHDLLVETVITLRYPGSPPELPKPEPAYVAPAPDPDGKSES